MAYIIDEKKCIGCGSCQGICPVSAITETNEEKYRISSLLCIDCSACAGVCPVVAISPE